MDLKAYTQRRASPLEQAFKNVSQVMIEDPEGIGQSSGDPFWKGKTSELPQAFSIHPLGEIHGCPGNECKTSHREDRQGF